MPENLNKIEVKVFIEGLKYPKLAAYVVNQLVKKFGISREDAILIWNEMQEER